MTTLIDAAKNVSDWIGRHDESPNELFERINDMYRRDTGYLRPGKDDAFGDSSSVENHARFNAWCEANSKNVRFNLESALTAHRAEILKRRSEGPWKGPFVAEQLFDSEGPSDWCVWDNDDHQMSLLSDKLRAVSIAAALNAYFGYDADGRDILTETGEML